MSGNLTGCRRAWLPTLGCGSPLLVTEFSLAAAKAVAVEREDFGMVGRRADGLGDRCNFGRSSWLISQVLSVTYVPEEHPSVSGEELQAP